MPPRIIQWQPVDSFDELFFVPRPHKEDAFSRKAAELGLSIAPTNAEIYAPGTNIDGGWIDVGDAAPIGSMRDGSVEELARMAAEMIDVCMPARFLVRDYDGWRAIHVDEDIAITNVGDWRRHLADENEHELLVEAVTEVIVALQRVARPEDLEDLEELVRLAPAQTEPYVLLGRLYLSLDRLDDATRIAKALLALDVRDYRKAPARTLLGEIATKRGDAKTALAEHQAALALHHTVPAQLAVGVAAIRANDPAAAVRTLAHRHRGRSMFELAEAMCKLGRVDDAHAYLEVAFDLDRDLLKPVPDNQWPKPPDTAWTMEHAGLVKLVDAARSRHG
ncbi:MAG: tetratricopeptide repeat protein [Kofleriaceae bacterium]